ncbi:MAG: AIR synthase-related protein [Thermoplasmata archaeon]
MDLEEQFRKLYVRYKGDEEKILSEGKKYTSAAKAKAIIEEIKSMRNISDKFTKFLCECPEAKISANDSGLGCRGTGDFFIHRKIADIIGRTSAVIDPTHQDDAGVVFVDDDYISVAVDGMHSRLSCFPFLAGFHAARAALRDIIVMGSVPISMFSDIHLANDGDVGKVFDYTAGIVAVSELSNVPLVTGSTLRIGGDLVLGDRLTGCVGAVGHSKNITPRKDAVPGDVILMTEGCGGGTITTTALYNNYHAAVKETLNVDNIQTGIALLKSPHIKNVHAMLDVTNGGIRGDAHETSEGAGVRIILDEEKIRSVVNPKVLRMLEKLDIDFLGVSLDSFVFILPQIHVSDLMKFMNKKKMKVEVVGRVEKGRGVFIKSKNKIKPLPKLFRESPYTPIKKVVDKGTSRRFEDAKDDIERAARLAILKKEKIKKWIRGRVRE